MEIFRLLDDTPIVKSYTVLDFKAWNTGYYIKIEIILRNGTFLYAREYSDVEERNYSFHWQDDQGVLLIRWDDAPHHKNLNTYPHHRHRGNVIEASTDISLEDVLRYIEKSLE